MVYGPAAPAGSTTDNVGRTVLPPRKIQGPVRPGTVISPKRRSGSGSSRTRDATVSISGDRVFINGQGFSVAPALQAEFIKSKTGGTGAQALAAITKAETLANIERVRQQKAFAKKIELDRAKAKFENRQVNIALLKILNERSRLQSAGVVEEKITSKDSKTGDKLEISRFRDKDGNRVQRTENKRTGEVKYTSFNKPKGGGNVRQTGGVILGGVIPTAKTAVEIAKTYKITPSNIPGFVLVKNVSGKIFRVAASGTAIIGSSVAGHKLTFKDGKIIIVDDINLKGRLKDDIPGEFKRLATNENASKFAKKYSIITDDNPAYLLVIGPNLKSFRVKRSGKVTVGKELAGHKLLFENGKIIAVDGKTTGARVEFVRPQPEVQLRPPSLFKKITSAFNIKKFRAYREKQRQDYYDLYGLKGNDRNFRNLASAVQTKKLTTKQNNKFTGLIIKDLKQDLLNPDTAIRAEAALIIAAVASGPLLGGAVGAAYKTPIVLAKDLGVEESLKDVSWKDVAKRGGVEFGKNAIQSYIALKLFGLGTKAISKAPSLAKFTLGKVGLQRAGIFTDKALKLALRKGLNVVGAQYLASVGVDVTKLGRQIKKKKYKAATVKASELLGVLVGFYGEKAVKGALRKVMLAEDPRIIITKGTKSKPFAIENRQITLARLNKVRKNLKGKRTIEFAKASPVREPRSKKIVTPEKRTIKRRGATGKIEKMVIDVPTPAGYATYAVGKEVVIVPRTFLRLRKDNLPKTYYKKWYQNVKKKGLLPTFKELGLPRTYKPTIYKGSGELLFRRRGESLKSYYARGQRTANKLKVVQVLISPKTVLGGTQPELEIKTIYPNPKGIKASVTRVKVGKDSFGHAVIVEIVAPKAFLQRLKFKIKAKVKFKKEALKYLTNRESKIAKDLSPRMIESYELLYVSKAKGSAAARNHMLKVEKNFRRILKQYKIKASDAEIKAVSRLHDILKLRGINVKDEPIIRKAILEGYLNEIPLIKKLNFKQRVRVANAIGFHQDVNPRTLKALRLNKFTKAFMNADRLDIVRTGQKVNPDLLYNLKAKRLIPKVVKIEFAKLNKLRVNKKGFTVALRKRYNSLVKKYPGLKGKRFEDKIIAENKAKYKKMSPKQKAKIKKQEKEYKDYKESLSEYKRLRKGKKTIVARYKTKRYDSYKSPKYKDAYRAGYNAGYNYRGKAPINYNSKYNGPQTPYTQGYKDAYKGKYNINYRTGKYSYKTKYKPKTPIRPIKKPPATPIITIPKGFKRKTLTKKQPAYFVVLKRRGKLVKLTPKPMILKDARDYLAYRLDKGLGRSAWFEPIGQTRNVVSLPRSIKGYYSKVSNKLRPYKINRGRKLGIRNGYIEKSKFIGDTKSEQRALRIARAKAKPKKKTVRRKPIKKVIKKKAVKKRPKRIIKTKSTKKKTKKKVVKRKTPTRKRKVVKRKKK